MAGKLLFACFFIGGVVPPYCEVSYCPSDKTNVGCLPPPQAGGPACGASPSVIPMTATLQTLILDLHNSYRSTLATGGLAPFSPARRMPTLQWDDELASQAGHLTRSCVIAADKCLNTEQFQNTGQNIRYTTTATTSDANTLIQQFVDEWWNENRFTNAAQIDSFPSDPQVPPIREFALMANDRTWKVGCAMQFWNEEHTIPTYYFVCNYSSNIIDGEAVYVTGTVASGCTTNQNPQHPGLCSLDEPF
ncbi:antigen 5 like allergen Cul n 1-like [Anopheles ziemanni]|uniref:antigen 5 like allergen Cul n 1-like n=1 Tax=Anopheles coustani TaxID=139045 RepID=UPI002659018D|nr:antigen 5 like allergen Cul n 1-like [Anopheles coustani]XP_058178376.1 antigen 5 like allergen Cul n 1-like [Anopheles ziemanni]